MKLTSYVEVGTLSAEVSSKRSYKCSIVVYYYEKIIWNMSLNFWIIWNLELTAIHVAHDTFVHLWIAQAPATSTLQKKLHLVLETSSWYPSTVFSFFVVIYWVTWLSTTSVQESLCSLPSRYCIFNLNLTSSWSHMFIWCTADKCFVLKNWSVHFRNLEGQLKVAFEN